MIGCVSCFTPDAKDSIDTTSKTFNAGSLTSPATTRNGIFPSAIQPKQMPSNISLEKDCIAIYVSDESEPLIVTACETLTFGRAIENSAQSSLIDLSPYDAYKYGLSRNHAALVKKQGQLYVHDCGSVNGSWLDGQRMKPYELYVVQPGTQLTLGQLPLQIFFSSLSY
jgi:hypothetical protein